MTLIRAGGVCILGSGDDGGSSMNGDDCGSITKFLAPREGVMRGV
jgi:hypothetical protein